MSSYNPWLRWGRTHVSATATVANGVPSVVPSVATMTHLYAIAREP
jgi:hypothetical protein